jgi:hypothetical protein
LSLSETAAMIVGILLLTVSGLGSVLGWASRLAWGQLTAVGQLMSGALPVVLLIVLVFFNTYVWLMAATITEPRLFLSLLILVSVATIFLVSRTMERVRATLNSAAAPARSDRRLLAGTPFEHLPDPPPDAFPLTRRERFNELFVLIATQIVQILTVSVFTALIFFALGLTMLNRELLDAWTHGGRSDATLLGTTIPVPQSLVNMTLFLIALTYMYISARAITDSEYRGQFLHPLIDDLKLTVLARNRYLYEKSTASTERGPVTA